MIPASAVAVVLVVGFIAGAWNYFLLNPERRVYVWPFVWMAGPAALMILMIVLSIMSSYVAWMSWILFVGAVTLAYFAIQNLRQVIATGRAEARELERKMMGR